MPKNIIHLYGASGSGTTTLGKYIAAQTGYLFMDTDDYFWLPTDPPFTRKRERAERIRLIKEQWSRAENAVLSGALAGWGDELIPYFTLAVRVSADQNLRICRIKDREARRFGKRIQPGGDMYEAHLAFLQWASEYDTGGMDMRSKAEHDQWRNLLQCPQITVDGGRPVEYNFQLVREQLAFCAASTCSVK